MSTLYRITSAKINYNADTVTLPPKNTVLQLTLSVWSQVPMPMISPEWLLRLRELPTVCLDSDRRQSAHKSHSRQVLGVGGSVAIPDIAPTRKIKNLRVDIAILEF